MSKLIVAVAAVALSVGLGGAVKATEYKCEYCQETKQYCQYRKVVTYQTVIEYRVVKEEYVQWVTESDHDGRPVQVKKTFCKEVEVPVRKVIPVVTWVKVRVVE
jgi:hypothetical protein